MPATLALQTPESQQAHNIRCKPYRQFVGYAGLGCSNRRHGQLLRLNRAKLQKPRSYV